MDLGPHAAYIWASYAAAALVLAGLIAWLMFDGRRQRRLFDDLESRGLGRPRGRAGASSDAPVS